jgi:hypothetical protein
MNWKALLLKLAGWLIDQALGRLLRAKEPQLFEEVDTELAHIAPDPGLAEAVIAKSIEKITGKPATSTQIGAVILKYSPVAAAKAEQAIVARLSR